MSGSGISWAICKSADFLLTTTPAPHHSVFYRPDALPVVQPTASQHWRQVRHLHLRKCWVVCSCEWDGTFGVNLVRLWLFCRSGTQSNTVCHWLQPTESYQECLRTFLIVVGTVVPFVGSVNVLRKDEISWGRASSYPQNMRNVTME